MEHVEHNGLEKYTRLTFKQTTLNARAFPCLLTLQKSCQNTGLCMVPSQDVCDRHPNLLCINFFKQLRLRKAITHLDRFTAFLSRDMH